MSRVLGLWLEPKVGDACYDSNGDLLRRIIRIENTLGIPQSFGGVIRYRSTAHVSSEATCWITTWQQWCRNAVKNGGTYIRAESTS